MNRRILLREVTVFLAFFGLTAIMTWPWILHVRDAVSDHGDSYSIAYWVWWDYHQTFHDPLHLFNATAFFPYKYTMAFTENDYGVSLLFFPLFALGFRTLTVHSVATLVAFAFSGYGMFRLARTLTAANGAAWIAGIVFAFIPYHFQRLPHLHLIFAGWIPLLLESLILFARQRSWRRAGWLGVAFTMNALTCTTWFILTLLPLTLSAVFLMAWWQGWHDRKFWIRGGSVFVGVSIVLLCFLLPYYRVHEMYGFSRSAADATGLSASPIHWFVVSQRNKFWSGFGARALVDELTLFPGLLPPLLAMTAIFLVKPLSQKHRTLMLPKIGWALFRRVLIVLLDLLAFAAILSAILTIGYGSIHLRLFGFELLRSSHLSRPLIYSLCLLGARWLIAYPQIIRRIIHQKNLAAAFGSNPRSVALVLGTIWGLTGFFGSFGMNFFFHRILFEYIPLFKSIRAPARWAMICYVGLALIAGIGAVRVVELVSRWRPSVPRTLMYVLLASLVLFEQRVAPIEFARGEADPDAITLRLKQTPMSGGIVELPAEKDNYAYYRYMLRAADHGRPIVTASSSFVPPIVQEIEALTLARPIPDRLIDLLESIPTSYLVIHNSLLSADGRSAIENFLTRASASGRIRYVNSYGDSMASDDLFAIVKTEPTAKTERPNRIDETSFFVRQQYSDLLKREPDPTEQKSLATLINGCNGAPDCLMDHRIRGALELFHLRDFQDTSYFTWLSYQIAFARMPKYDEWLQDIGQVGTSGAKDKLSFAKELIARREFLDHYPERLTNREYISKLLRASGQTLSQANNKALVDDLNNGKMTRAELFVKVTDDSLAVKHEYSEAFVAMCYLDYLKREPDSAELSYWMQILKNPDREAAVIKGFIYSAEYRARFGRP